jgi:glycosyltransferase involved in cell wall biosynthesis
MSRDERAGHGGSRATTTVLLVSNVGPGDTSGRAEKLASRQAFLRERGVDVVFGTVDEPYVRTALPGAVRLVRLARREDVDLVTSVSNPFHLQLLGFVVSAALGLPWVAEFRDPMVESPDRDPDALVTKAARVVEWLTARAATRVVWGDGIQLADDYFDRRYGIGAKATKLPFHGFDPARFEGADAHDHPEFTVTYAGSFYEGWIEPYRFLEGLRVHVQREGDQDGHGDDGVDGEHNDDGDAGNGDDDGDLRVQFYGDWNDEYQGAVEAAGLDDVVTHHEFVPPDEIVPVLKGSDLLLYVGGDDPANRLNVPSKIWDYVGSRTPILAVVDPSFRVAELIEEYGLGLVVDPEDAEGIAAAIAAVRSGEYRYDPDPAAFGFTRETKFERLAELYREVAGR